MNVSQRTVKFSIQKPKLVTTIMVIATILLGALIPLVHVDTDPENMLSKDESVRIFHSKMKQEFNLYDVIVLGVVNETHPHGVFNPATLKRVEEISNFAYGLNWPDPKNPSKQIGVVRKDMITPGNIDHIQQDGAGQVRFDWLMKEAPETQEGALKIRDDAMSNPLLKGTLVSEDGKALCIYLPITDKHLAYRIRSSLKDEIAAYSGKEKFYITGLPVAESTFGVEMFIQMAICAPLAMIAVFLMMLFFFKQVKLILSPMIVAMVSVICTMGLLIGTGNTLHIMSSMIPIFLMPIAVVDSIHILSEFFDQYQTTRDREKTLKHVMAQLFVPMLFTSLTTSAGFASLALTPIPPVRIFGIFVALGIMLAWALTILFIPAYIMMMKEESLKTLGAPKKSGSSETSSFMARHLRWIGNVTYRYPKVIVTCSILILVIAVYGISFIRINDNPVKWFQKDHPISVADRVLNNHFAGTYEAYFTLEAGVREETTVSTAGLIKERLKQTLSAAPAEASVLSESMSMVDDLALKSVDSDTLVNSLARHWEDRMDGANDGSYDLWGEAVNVLEDVRTQDQIFKQPSMLRYIESLQDYLMNTGLVGKSNSVTDIVKKVYQELYVSDPVYFRVPDSESAVAQTLISYQGSHNPDFLWHFVTPDYKKANIWIQLKSGDNKDMEAVTQAVDRFFESFPPPLPLSHGWAGLTYLNVVWQDKMVSGMLKSLLGSFVVVFIMMTFLFRSPLWGIVAMVPLTVTIALIYGMIGLVGKDYDMPVAVLSSLTLGLAIDFAIHFLQRSRTLYQKVGSWKKTAELIFEEPARAISRNVMVIAVGFTPLLLAPLVPYQTVGIFLASIMMISGIATLFILPSLVRVMRKPMGITKK